MEMGNTGLSEVIANNSALIASFFGSLTSAFFSDLKTWREKILATGFGLCTAYYLGDIPHYFLDMGRETSGFLMGFFGLNVCAAFLKAVRRFGDNADFWTLFRELIETSIDKLKLTAKVLGSDKSESDSKEQ